MSGNSIQIFSVIVTVMLLWNSIKAIMGTNAGRSREETLHCGHTYVRGVTYFFLATTVFERFSTRTNTGAEPRGIAALLQLGNDPLLWPKLVYIALQLGCLALGVWKCGAMGLLPTATSDWLAFMEPKMVMERAFGGLRLQ